jgi:starch-binding outer membrane protein, SusD/RagB family
VKTYADNGITADWNIVMDGTSTWYFEAGDYLTYPGWGRTDMYVVNLMDPTQPKHWDDSPTFPHPPASTNPVDQRLNTDFQFLASNDFLAARGYYHFSNYRNKRYDAIYVAAIGEKAEVMKAENDLLKAEARAYTGDLAGAAAIINAGTRVTRGGMAPVAAVLADIVKAIHHERHVELYTTGMGIQFFEMRKLNLLQKGTPLHFPIPAKILELFRLSPPFYTFGTEAKADGIGTSNAGWR